MIDLNDGLAQEYLAECLDHLDTMENDLCTLEKEGKGNDEECARQLFRAANLIRVGALFFGLTKVRELAQHTEDALELVCEGTLPLTPDRARVLLGATDRLRDLVRNPSESNYANISDITAAVAGLSRLSAETLHPRERSEVDTRPRMLLVEDDFTSRLILHTFLSCYGECHVAVNGREAVEAFRSSSERGEKYDLICMDIMMPEMDGREALRLVRELEQSQGIRSTAGVKVIMTTAVDEVREVSKCFTELCDAYLTKPVDLRKLMAQLKSWHLVR